MLSFFTQITFPQSTRGPFSVQHDLGVSDNLCTESVYWFPPFANILQDLAICKTDGLIINRSCITDELQAENHVFEDSVVSLIPSRRNIDREPCLESQRQFISQSMMNYRQKNHAFEIMPVCTPVFGNNRLIKMTRKSESVYKPVFEVLQTKNNV